MALFDDCTGKWALSNGVWTDASGNSNTLTATGTITNIQGHYGSAYTAAGFAGASYLTIADASQTGLDFSSAMSVSGWFRFTASGTSQFLVTKLGASAHFSYAFYKDQNNALVFQYSTNGTALTTKTSTSVIPSFTINTWYLLGASYDGVDVKFYVNGAQLGNPVATTGSIYNSDATFAIGRRYFDTTGFLIGSGDDIAVWSRAISLSEHGELYTPYSDDFVYGSLISGLVRNKNGIAIDCSVYPVVIHILNKDTGIPVVSTSCTASNGAWNARVPGNAKYLVTFSYEGLYGGDMDIAGAEFMVSP